MEKEVIKVGKITEWIDEHNVPVSAAVKANGFVFVAGLPAIDVKTGELIRGDIPKQTQLSLEAIKAALESAGSSLEKVVKTTIFITNSAYFQTVNEIYRQYFPKNYPARTFVTMASWPYEFDIEIECIAIE